MPIAFDFVPGFLLRVCDRQWFINHGFRFGAGGVIPFVVGQERRWDGCVGGCRRRRRPGFAFASTRTASSPSPSLPREFAFFLFLGTLLNAALAGRRSLLTSTGSRCRPGTFGLGGRLTEGPP